MKKKIGLVAHDARKKDMLQWVEHNASILSKCQLICTGTTGKLIMLKLEELGYKCDVVRLKSGPLGGDQQMGAKIANNEIDLLVFLVDNLSMQPHDVDIKALERLSQLYNIPAACNRSTADYLVTSPLFEDSSYERIIPDFTEYTNRDI